MNAKAGKQKASKHRAAAAVFVRKVLSKRGRMLLAKAGFGLPKRS